MAASAFGVPDYDTMALGKDQLTVEFLVLVFIASGFPLMALIRSKNIPKKIMKIPKLTDLFNEMDYYFWWLRCSNFATYGAVVAAVVGVFVKADPSVYLDISQELYMAFFGLWLGWVAVRTACYTDMCSYWGQYATVGSWFVLGLDAAIVAVLGAMDNQYPAKIPGMVIYATALFCAITLSDILFMIFAWKHGESMRPVAAKIELGVVTTGEEEY